MIIHPHTCQVPPHHHQTHKHKHFNLYSSLTVSASLQRAFNAVRCHAASHKLKCNRERSLSFSVVKHVLPDMQRVRYLIQSMYRPPSVSFFLGWVFYGVTHVWPAIGRNTSR